MRTPVRASRRKNYFFFAAGFLAAGFLAAAFLAGFLAATFFTDFLAVAMMYLLFGLVLGLSPDEALGKGSPDTAPLALRERQHSGAKELCKPRLRKNGAFSFRGKLVVG